MKYKDLMAQDRFNDFAADLIYWPRKKIGGPRQPSVPPGTVEKTPTGVKHTANPKNPNKTQLEATGDKKFDKMLRSIIAPSDTQKYNQMIGDILDPELNPKKQAEKRFQDNVDRLLDELEDVILRGPDSMKKELHRKFQADPNNIGDWMMQNAGIPPDAVDAARTIIRGMGGYDIFEFFNYDPDSFYKIFVSLGIDIKLSISKFSISRLTFQ